jgi:hypothetical protein
MIKTIFDEITSRVGAFMESSNMLLLEKCHVGSGKTWNTIKAIEDRGDTWIYLAPFHTVIDENLKFSTLRNYNYIHLKSRAKLCLIREYKKIAKQRVDIRPICEYSCPLKDTTCPYYEIKRELFNNPCSWAGVHHHLKNFVGDFFKVFVENQPMWKYYDVMIIDENPINVLFENDVADAESLGVLRGLIREFNLSHPHNERILDFLDFLIVNFSGRELLNYEQLLEHFQGINWKTFYDVYQEHLVEELRLDRLQLSDLPKEYIKIFGVMQGKATPETLPYMFIKKSASPYTIKKYHFMVFNNTSLLQCPIKIIGLDGTANTRIWESITERRSSLLERRYIYKNIYQLKGQGLARYPLSSWIRNRELTHTGIRLCKLIDLICNRRKTGKVLIICTKTLQNYLTKQLQSKNIMYCNYYYLRSRNDFYEICDTVILTCEPNIQRFQIDCFSQLSGWDIEVWRQVFTQEEMIQGVGRNREDRNTTISGRQRKPREIYILPHTPPTNEESDIKKPLYPESMEMNYNNMEFFIKTGIIQAVRDKELKDKLLEEMDKEGSLHESSFRKDNPIFKRGQLKELLKELKKEGVIREYGGQRGWERIYN